MKNSNSLQPKIWLMIMLCATTFLATSCSEDDDPSPIVVTVDDAAELVALSLANRTYGAVNDLNYVAEEILELVDCNESQTNNRTVSDASLDGDIAVDFEISETYSKTCEEEEIVNYSFNTNQSLTSVRYNFEHDINGAWSIEGVEEQSTEVLYNGPYTRSGLWIYNLQDNRTDDITYSSTMIDLSYDPNTDRITGGTSTFTLDGTSTVYDPFSYEGKIEFLGSDISIITFQTGEQYELNLETGEIIAL